MLRSMGYKHRHGDVSTYGDHRLKVMEPSYVLDS